MREKVIFDGRIDGSPKEVQEIIDLFMFENLGLPGIDYRTEKESQKQLYVILPQGENLQKEEKIINGYTEITTSSLSKEKPVKLLIVSCRVELDLLYFQLSQIIQAKFIIEGFPPGLLATPWKELVSQGYISPLSNRAEDVLVDNLPNPKGKIPNFGRDRDLTEEQVIEIVAACSTQMARGATVGWYYDHLPQIIQNKFALGTLKDWMKDPRFRKQKKFPRNLPS